MAKAKKTNEVDSVVKENLTTEVKSVAIEEPSEIKELKEIIERLKCCGNCNNYGENGCSFSSIGGCKDLEKWIIRK